MLRTAGPADSTLATQPTNGDRHNLRPFPPTDQALADKALGFVWSDFSLWGLENSGSFSLLVFARTDRVIHAEKRHRCSPDFFPALGGSAVLRAAAEFKIAFTGERPRLEWGDPLQTRPR